MRKAQNHQALQAFAIKTKVTESSMNKYIGDKTPIDLVIII